jgi:hypothetical protein
VKAFGAVEASFKYCKNMKIKDFADKLIKNVEKLGSFVKMS